MKTRHCAIRSSSARSKSKPRVLEVLEDRRLMSTFTVTNLGNSGDGSFRQAIIEANARPGPDAIDFDVAGVIQIQHMNLPAITDTLAINGGSAPTFAGSPVVTLNFRGCKGLEFAPGADGSFLGSLSIINAKNAGVTLSASRVTVQGNYIGLMANGSTVAGNRGDGIQINASSHDNLIGRADPVSGVDYYNANSVSMQPVTGWQGIRAAATSGQYLITGTSQSNGLLYEGPITGQGGTSYSVNYPGATATSVYGPDLLSDGSVRLVGSYKNGDGVVHGFLFQGTTSNLSSAGSHQAIDYPLVSNGVTYGYGAPQTTSNLSNTGSYQTIDYPGAQYTYVHSTMGGFAVGNADGPEGPLPIGTGHAFLYDVEHSAILTDIVYPGSTSTTAYGIWDNGMGSYTIAGGYTTLGGSGTTLGHGYLVDYDSLTGKFSNWTSFDYPNGVIGQDYATHFEGISSVESGVYTLSADSIQRGASNAAQGSWVSVRRNTDGSFGPAAWVDLNVPGSQGLTSNDSVIGNQVVGITIAATGVTSYQATVNIEFQLSNVISGNGGNGIGVYGSNNNRISMNYIGTDASGTLKRSNTQNGILITNGAARNLIGGEATAGNDPTAGVFARPPQGNLISGNRGNGVLINKGATANELAGNFIGTAASGNSPLGNRLDGVAIDRADGNSLLGCTFQQSPFVFYNVLSGNGGNGLRITNANNTTVQANFLGVGANNAVIVGNGGDGLLISGTSQNTQVGGVIPLGNVISGNNGNGIEVRDKASGFISFNTFAGLFAFGNGAPNKKDGILITSTGGNNVVRTSILSGNYGNGIEIGGNATGVEVTQVAAGTNTSIMTPLANRLSGIKISGRAHGNTIGGFEPSVVPQVTVSSNLRYGIEIVGHAHDNKIINTYVGTNFNGTSPLGNGLDGIYLGAGTSSTTIGGSDPSDQVKVLYNGGNGLTIQCSLRNAVVGNEFSVNQGFGVYAGGNSAGTVIKGGMISGNARGQVDLTHSKGVVYIP